ncbi:uncharacterized protein LOC144459406 isoform X1 [Epinephelus lanceolatus]
MRAFQMSGCLSAVIRAVLISVCLLTSVRGDGADSTEQPDWKYVLIGGGIGLFLAAGFIIVMACLIRKYMYNGNTGGGGVKRTLEVPITSVYSQPQPQAMALSSIGPSEPPVAAVSSDMQW